MKSLKAMLNLLKSKGLLLITAAFYGRPEHGTKDHYPESSPFTNAFYQNINSNTLNEGLDFEMNFLEWKCLFNSKSSDIYFWGIKK
jgi:hypothetical protein